MIAIVEEKVNEDDPAPLVRRAVVLGPDEDEIVAVQIRNPGGYSNFQMFAFAAVLIGLAWITDD